MSKFSICFTLIILRYIFSKNLPTTLQFVQHLLLYWTNIDYWQYHNSKIFLLVANNKQRTMVYNKNYFPTPMHRNLGLNRQMPVKKCS
jgi:hypothetical protein